MSNESPAHEVWRQQSVWSQVANAMKSSIGRARAASLILTAVSAVLAALAGALAKPQPVVGSVLAVAAGVGVGLIPLLRPRWSGAAVRDWTRARSVSEALKSEVYLYLAGAGDYAGPDRDARLTERADAVVRDAADLLRHGTAIEPVRRDLPAVTDCSSYFPVRVDSQVDGYYRPRARQLQTRLGQFRLVEVALAVVGVVLGALAASSTQWGLSPWIAVVTTLTVAVAAHVAATRYDYQLVEYLRTADELARLRRAASRTSSPAELDELVVKCERVISIQNEGWMARLSAAPEAEPGLT